jgi:hypothetical protein
MIPYLNLGLLDPEGVGIVRLCIIGNSLAVTWGNIPEDINLPQHRCQNFKSRNFTVIKTRLSLLFSANF